MQNLIDEKEERIIELIVICLFVIHFTYKLAQKLISYQEANLNKQEEIGAGRQTRTKFTEKLYEKILMLVKSYFETIKMLKTLLDVA